MFGLQSPSKKSNAKLSEFVFELEKEMKSPEYRTGIQKKVEKRLQQIKEKLRSGTDSSKFGDFEAVLNGYASLLKVMARFQAK